MRRSPTKVLCRILQREQFGMLNKKLILALFMIVAVVPAALGSSAAGHIDPIPRVLVALVVILATAKLSADAVGRLGLPIVLSELLGGVILGNMCLLNPGWSFFEPLHTTPFVTDWAVIIGGLA